MYLPWGDQNMQLACLLGWLPTRETPRTLLLRSWRIAYTLKVGRGPSPCRMAKRDPCRFAGRLKQRFPVLQGSSCPCGAPSGNAA